MAHCQNTDLYAVLGIPASAGEAAVRSAYRRASLRSHPDKGGSVDQFHKVTLAFEVLSDPVARGLYDRRRRCRAPRQTLHSDAQGKKRRSRDDIARSRPSKQARKASPRQELQPGRHALQRMVAVLQIIDATQRRQVLSSLGQRAQRALLSFMSSSASTANSSPAARRKTPSMRSQHHSFATSDGVKVIKYAHNRSYQASLQIRDLRLYTPERAELQAAIDDKIILVRFRNAMATAALSNNQFWDDPLAQQAVYDQVLEERNTTDSQLGLRAWVQMRCNRWLGDRCKVSSSVSSLSIALQVHTRLHSADMLSWQAFRAEWVQLILLRGKQSHAEAESFVDNRRQAAIDILLARAVLSVEHVFGAAVPDEAAKKQRHETR